MCPLRTTGGIDIRPLGRLITVAVLATVGCPIPVWAWHLEARSVTGSIWASSLNCEDNDGQYLPMSYGPLSVESRSEAICDTTFAVAEAGTTSDLRLSGPELTWDGFGEAFATFWATGMTQIGGGAQVTILRDEGDSDSVDVFVSYHAETAGGIVSGVNIAVYAGLGYPDLCIGAGYPSPDPTAHGENIFVDRCVSEEWISVQDCGYACLQVTSNNGNDEGGFAAFGLRLFLVDSGQPSSIRFPDDPAASPDEPDRLVILDPPYPNPFADRMECRYVLRSAARVQASVYNVAGQLCRRLLDDEQKPGTHALRWDGLDDEGRPANRGLHLLRLHAGNQEVERKVLLLR